MLKNINELVLISNRLVLERYTDVSQNTLRKIIIVYFV
jgi:hypothetical protein